MTITPRGVDPLAERQARILVDSFNEFHEHFLEVTQRGADTFLRRDWSAGQDDAAHRLELHKKFVTGAVQACRLTLPDDDAQARRVWVDTRRRYVELISARIDLELAETFYNSVTRRLFGIIGLDPELEFLWLGPTALPADDVSRREYRSIPVGARMVDAIRDALDGSPLAGHFDDVARDSQLVADRIEAHVSQIWDGVDSIDLMHSVFYRNKGAYLDD